MMENRLFFVISKLIRFNVDDSWLNDAQVLFLEKWAHKVKLDNRKKQNIAY